MSAIPKILTHGSSYNWIRSDTVFIENEQIETLSNLPLWAAAALKQRIPAKSPDSFPLEEGLSPAENMIAHVVDVGANYRSLWNFHAISAKNLQNITRHFLRRSIRSTVELAIASGRR